MPDTENPRARLDARLRPVLELLRRHRLVDRVVSRQHGDRQELVESIVHRQQRAELETKVTRLRDGEIAHLLEMVPARERMLLWDSVPPERAAQVLWDASDLVADELVAATDEERLLEIGRVTDPADLPHIMEHFPEPLVERIAAQLAEGERERFRESIAYPEDQLGHHMSTDFIAIPEGGTLKEALRAIRARGTLPEQTDQLFVVDGDGRVAGLLSLGAILLNRPRTPVAEVMQTDFETFVATDDAEEAAHAFERYDLVSAPVLDARGRLVGRLTVEEVIDMVREEAEEDALARDGLSPDEDLVGRVWTGARRRWLWLGINLTTAFVASRVIGVFEHTIQQVVAVATLMPIVASIGGNTGNQTIALVVRGLALGQLSRENIGHVWLKELGIGLVNGTLWGTVIGLATFALYGSPALAAVMTVATVLNLLVAACTGVAVPLALRRAGRDPAMGSSVLLTFTTDGMGFLIFLGLATIVLL